MTQLQRETDEFTDLDSTLILPIPDRQYVGSTTNAVRRGPALLMSWRRQAERLQKEAKVFYFVFKHPRVHWYARLVAVCTAAYPFSPIQLIPSFIPVIGFLDDLLVLFLAERCFKGLYPRTCSPNVVSLPRPPRFGGNKKSDRRPASLFSSQSYLCGSSRWSQQVR